MGRIFKGLKFVLVLIVCTLLMSSVGVHKAYASQMSHRPQDEGDTGQATKVYILIYPYGPSETVYNKEVAENKTKEWKLLYTGTTDEKGQIVLEKWMTEYDIRIVEKEAPEGYEIIEEEKIVPLKDGETTFVNKKKEEPKPETPRPVTIPKTGIDSLTPYKSHHPHPDTPQEPEEEETKEDEKADFIINKVDKEGKPLKGAKFEVYGKPVIEEKYEIKITKNYKNIGVGPEVDVNLPKANIDISGPKVDIEVPDVDIKGPEDNTVIPDFPDNTEENQEAPETQEEPCFLMAVPPTRGGDQETGNSDTNQNNTDSNNGNYLEVNITIRVKGNGVDLTETVTPENNTVTFILKPGEYTISETSSLIGQSASIDDIREQSYLYSYQITISEDGAIIRQGDSQWLWLRSRDTGTEVKYMLDSCSQNHDGEVGVKLEGDTITITNFAFKFDGNKKCPPKSK
jgi:hypothetical protein